jgi:hypothetical protein
MQLVHDYSPAKFRNNAFGLAKLGKVCKRSRRRVPRTYMAGVTIKYASPFAAIQAIEASRGRASSRRGGFTE